MFYVPVHHFRDDVIATDRKKHREEEADWSTQSSSFIHSFQIDLKVPTTFSNLLFRMYELVGSCDSRGVIQEISRWKTRSMSGTIKRADQDVGGDLCFYLEGKA